MLVLSRSAAMHRSRALAAHFRIAQTFRAVQNENSNRASTPELASTTWGVHILHFDSYGAVYHRYLARSSVTELRLAFTLYPVERQQERAEKKVVLDLSRISGTQPCALPLRPRPPIRSEATT
jgi:hypothetical protein